MFNKNTHLQINGKALSGKNLDLQLQAGERLCLQGSNGCGKTSLLLILAGLQYHPEHPEVRVLLNGVQTKHNLTEFQAQFHWIAHLGGLNPQMTLLEEWQFWAKIMRSTPSLANPPIAFQPILDRFNLDKVQKRLISTLSAGQRRKVALGRLLIEPRQIWLLDEPHSALDSDSRESLETMMQDHCQQGGIVITSQHFAPSFGAILQLDEV